MSVRLRLGSSMFGCLLAAACAPVPVVEKPVAPPAAAEVPEDTTIENFERRHADRARNFARQGRWAEAAYAWEVLVLLRPENAAYRKGLDDARGQIRQMTGERIEKAEAARKSGDARQAEQLYLRVLALDADHAGAIDGLRALEKERSARLNHSRVARANGQTMRAPKPAAPVAYVERRDLDYGVMLFHQGDYGASLATLDKYLKANPKDELGRRYVAESHLQLGHQRLGQGRREEALAHFEKARSYRKLDTPELDTTIRGIRSTLAEEQYQKGVRAYAEDIRLAMTYWERSLQYDPGHTRSQLRLDQAKEAAKKLDRIRTSP
jgi:tetratricopeptide (TPR) repeat protein